MQKALLSPAQYRQKHFHGLVSFYSGCNNRPNSHRRAVTLVTDQIAGVQFLDRPGRREAVLKRIRYELVKLDFGGLHRLFFDHKIGGRTIGT
jgi:hypothetical protein